MALASGSKLGPYEILAPLGAGGMGEVYRARDTRLDRTVAIKVLPPELSVNPDRRQRFEREARTISSLNHPHICTLHDIGHQEGIDYLVMEYVEGETLAKKLEGGPLPTEAVLRYGIEIADALDKAHRQGVIHRDLKPGNIMLTKSGAKLLDFGLAKVLPRSGGLLPATTPTAAPTASQPLTAEGTIVGTCQYMSPEQVEGKEADARSDLFALGTVLYEMATGRPAFQGKSTASLIAAILTSEPQPITTLQPMAPPALDRVVKTCLAKDRDDRWQTAHDLTVELKWVAEGHSSVAMSSPSPGARTGLLQGRAILLSLAVLAALSTAALLWSLLRVPPPPTRPVARLVMDLPPTDHLELGYTPVLAMSPDGMRLVYVANRGGSRQLYLRSLDRFEATSIPGTEGAETPFFSPDGQWVGFFADGKLKKISLRGGVPLTLCSASVNRGASWGPDDTIIFTPSNLQSGLFRVSAGGGTPKPLTVSDSKKGELSHRWPQILPGGQAVLITIWTATSFDTARIDLLSLETGERRTLVEGGAYAQYVPSGHLLYARAGGLLAVPFDLKRLEVTGPPVPILDGVTMTSVTGASQFSTSADGSLAYVPGVETGVERTLVWVDRKGAPQPLPAPPRAYMSPRLSPDGQRVALAIVGHNPGVWLYEPAREALTRLIENNADVTWVVWTPDGRRVTFSSFAGGPWDLYWVSADGSGGPERLATGESYQWPGSWSPDGQTLAFSKTGPTTGSDIWVLKLKGERKPQPFLQTPANESGALFSPDGRWLAYESDELGRWEIYVRPFPGPGGKWQISTEGGVEPVWARNGRELFYRNGDKMMAAAVETKPTFAAAKPKLLFERHYEASPQSFLANYDVSPDGQRFLMIKPSEQESAATQLNVVLNWSDEVRRLVPAGRK